MSFQNKDKIFEKIKHDLFPEVQSFNLIFKIFFIHALSSALVTSLCPQFGFGLFKNGHYGLTSLFMSISHEFCQIMCGLTLFSISFFSIYFNLKITEIEWILSRKYFFASVLILVTGSFFWMWAPHVNILNLMLWTVGAGVSAGLGNHWLVRSNS